MRYDRLAFESTGTSRIWLPHLLDFADSRMLKLKGCEYDHIHVSLDDANKIRLEFAYQSGLKYKEVSYIIR